jgi:AAA domain/Bifunctional DNA primase/polymerase, N-terminal
MIKQEAQQLLEAGYKIIPLLQNQKSNWDKEILTKNYLLEDFDKLNKQFNKSHTNLGINVATSLNGLIDIDLDSKEAIKLAPKFFPMNTAIIGRKNEQRLEITHFLFIRDQDYSNVELERTDINKKKIIEFRTQGNLVVPPSITPNKENADILMPRVWINKVKPIKVLNILKIFNWCCFASFIYPFIESANTGALSLDAAIKRYTDATDDQRLKFLEILFSTKFPEKWNRDKDFKTSKFKRIIKANNNEATKTGGYRKLATYHKIDPLEVRRALSWIGEVPDEETKAKSKKTITSFMENSLDMKAILNTEFPPVQFAVKPILPEGLGLIAGRPKAMKSWTMLHLAYCVQNNLPFLGHDVRQGDVLYLALEDNARRLKDRIVKLGHDKLRAPTINLVAPYLNFGLEESISEWVKDVMHPRLVIIDTLAKVKQQFDRTNTAYDKDNNLLRDIQHLAGDLSLTIGFVSHLGKAQQDYSWDRIQGSTGMQGMTDWMWMLDRGDEATTASLKGRGRDIEDFEYALNWNKETWKYENSGALWEVTLNESRQQVLAVMKHFAHVKKQIEVKPSEVAAHLGETGVKAKAKIQKTMQRMVEGQHLVNGSTYGTYKLYSSLAVSESAKQYETETYN